MATNVNTVVTKFNGRGISFMDFFYKSSPLFKAIFYDWSSIMRPNTALKPKEVQTMSSLLEDGYTLKWRDTDLRRENTTIDGAVSAAATTMDVAAGDGALFRAGDSILIGGTYQQTHVVTAVSTDTLTISPAVPAGGYADTTAVKILTSAIDNGGTVGGKEVIMPIGGELTNYIQHFSRKMQFSQEELNKIIMKYTTMGASEAQAVQSYIKELSEQTLRQMQTDLVNAFWFGTKRAETIGGKTYRYTGGIAEFKDSTTVDCTDSTDKARLLKVVDALDNVSKVQNLEGDCPNILVVTPRAKSRLSALANDRTQEPLEYNKIGFRIDVIRTTYGDIPVYVDSLLEHLTDNANVGYVMNPKLIDVVSTTKLPANINKGFNDNTVLEEMSGIIFHKDETSSVQPNSPAIVNAYTNLGFKFHGSNLGFYKKLINIGE